MNKELVIREDKFMLGNVLGTDMTENKDKSKLHNNIGREVL